MTKNEIMRKWYNDNREHALAYAKAYRAKLGKEKIRKANKEYRDNNPEGVKAACASWRARNPEKRKKSLKRWELKNVDRKRELRRISQERNKHKPENKIRKAIRGVTGRIKRMTGKGTDSASRFLGAPISYVRAYIEARFKEGMTWQNHGKVWHLDHIMPLASFDLTNPAHIKKAAHYTNLQPMFKEDNLRKRDSLPEVQLFFLAQ
jgi:hypothetical protein